MSVAIVATPYAPNASASFAPNPRLSEDLTPGEKRVTGHALLTQSSLTYLDRRSRVRVPSLPLSSQAGHAARGHGDLRRFVCLSRGREPQPHMSPAAATRDPLGALADDRQKRIVQLCSS